MKPGFSLKILKREGERKIRRFFFSFFMELFLVPDALPPLLVASSEILGIKKEPQFLLQ